MYNLLNIDKIIQETPLASTSAPWTSKLSYPTNIRTNKSVDLYMIFMFKYIFTFTELERVVGDPVPDQGGGRAQP